MNTNFFRFFVFCALLISGTLYAQAWLQISSLPVTTTDINSISVPDANTIWVCGTTGRVYRSTNGGFNWVAANTGLPTGDLYGISALDVNNCWVGTGTGSIYVTSNGGTSWTLQVAVAGSFINGIKMFSLNDGVYTGDPTGSGQPYQNRTTSNGGTSWVLSPTSPVAGNEFGVINAWDWTNNTTFWIGSANLAPNATNAKIYRTTTGFTGTWSAATVNGTGGAQGLYYQAIAFINATSGMAGSNGNNVVRTTDGGVTWVPAVNPPGVTTYAAINMHGFKDGSNIIRIVINETAGYKVFRTTNLGASWIAETLPTSGQSLGLQHMQFVNQSLGFAGGAAGSIFRYGPPLGIDPVNTEIPKDFALLQNYPNPFNPGTTIKYSVPKSGNVSIRIFNSIGAEVTTVVNHYHIAGNYVEYIDMSAHPSGIYFYTMNSGEFKETMKMMLVK